MGAANPTAAILLIGNELLSGKVEDENARFLTRELRALGVALRRIEVVPDVTDEIADSVRTLSPRFDNVFTSGGVGPTHDDVTVKAVAQAFGRKVVQDPTLAKMLRDHYQERLTDGHLQMALVPEGASLHDHPSVRWPTIRIENTWLLPGVPEIFKMKLAAVIEGIRQDGAAQFVSRAVYTKMDEGDLKPLLDSIVDRFPDVSVGSYPKWQNPAYKTMLTFDGRDPLRVDAAHDAFVALLPPGVICSPP